MDILFGLFVSSIKFYKLSSGLAAAKIDYSRSLCLAVRRDPAIFQNMRARTIVRALVKASAAVRRRTRT